jgi:hypothetical protein
MQFYSLFLNSSSQSEIATVFKKVGKLIICVKKLYFRT